MSNPHNIPPHWYPTLPLPYAILNQFNLDPEDFIFSNNTTGAELYVNGQGMFQNEFFPNSYSKIGDQGSIDLYNQGTNVVSLGGSGILTLRDPLNGTGNQIILNSNDGTNS